MTSKIRFTLLCTVLVLLLTPAWSLADPFNCKGTVDNLYVYKGGGVFAKVSWLGAYTKFCSLTDEWKGVPTSTCFGWYNLLLTIQREGAEARVRYPTEAGTCETIGKYSNAEAPYYIMME